MTEAPRIMVVSHDPQLGDVRKSLLVAAGFQVLAVSNIREVRAACQKSPQLIMIGYSLPPSAKRLVWAEVRECCKAPILELHKNEPPSIMAHAFFHNADRPDDFLGAVRRILEEAS